MRKLPADSQIQIAGCELEPAAGSHHRGQTGMIILVFLYPIFSAAALLAAFSFVHFYRKG